MPSHLSEVDELPSIRRRNTNFTAPRASKRRLESVDLDELLETDAAGCEVPGSGFPAKKRAVENVNGISVPGTQLDGLNGFNGILADEYLNLSDLSVLYMSTKLTLHHQYPYPRGQCHPNSQIGA